MSEYSEVTREDVRSAYKVLETMRDKWALEGEEDYLNDAHVLVQKYESQVFRDE